MTNFAIWPPRPHFAQTIRFLEVPAIGSSGNDPEGRNLRVTVYEPLSYYDSWPYPWPHPWPPYPWPHPPWPPHGFPHPALRRLVVMTHGSGTALENSEQTMPAFLPATRFFLSRGYVVATVLRRGSGIVGGTQDDRFVVTSGASRIPPGRETALDIWTTIAYLANQPAAYRLRDVLIVGHSAGGWGGVVAASDVQLPAQAPPMLPGIAWPASPLVIKGVINFAGGRGGNQGPNGTVFEPGNLIADAGALGQGSRIPTLWFYAEGDSFFSPALAQSMHDSFSASGGAGQLILLPALSRVPGDASDVHDGHHVFTADIGLQYWTPAAANFLDSIGM